MIIKDNGWSNLVRKTFPDTPVVAYEECENRLATATRIQVWFSDVDLPRRLRVFEAAAVRAVISMRRARALLKDNSFIYRPLQLAHQRCGGMTDGEWKVHLYLRDGAWEIASPTDLPGRDKLSIVNTKLQGMPCPAPPKVSTNSEAKVREVRPGLYRTDGLCPWGMDRVQVVAPCVFSVTKWARRPLSGRELCLLKDVSEEIQASLRSKDIAVLCKDKSLIPLKICTRVLGLMTIKKVSLVH